MLTGLGIDLVEIERIAKSLENERFIQRIFTPLEIEYCEARKTGRTESFAARFAAKEAMAKALGCGIGAELEFKEIEVFNAPNGKPQIRLLGKSSQNHPGLNFHLSLTHTAHSAAAVVVAEKELTA